MMSEPSDFLDEVVHQRSRLGILTIAREAKRVEFGFLQEALGLTAGNLSRHLQVLEETGFISIEKGYAGRRAKTWVTITTKGIDALRVEIVALKEIVARVEMAERAKRSVKARPRQVAPGTALATPGH
jgi:DNA-binding MarR family transcriptional regulator